MSYQSLIVLFTVWLTLTTGIIPQPNLLEESMGWSLCFVEITLSLTAMSQATGHEDFSPSTTESNFQSRQGHAVQRIMDACFRWGCSVYRKGGMPIFPARNPWARNDLLERSWGRKWNDNHQKKNAKKSTARRYISRICIDLSFFLLIRMLGEDSYLEPETSSLKWLFQFDDSKSLHKKLLFH